MLIDLGTERDAPVAPGPWATGRVGRWFVRLGRRGQLLGAAVLVLLVALVPTLGGAAESRPGLARVFALTDRAYTFHVAGGRLALVTVADAVVTVSVYRLADGTPLWTQTSPAPARPETGYYLTAVSGVLLVVSTEADRQGGDVDAYDFATGRSLWGRRGAPIGPLAGGRVLLTTPDPDPCPYPPCDGSSHFPNTPYQLSSVDLDTGRAGWTVRLTGAENAGVGFDWSPEDPAVPLRRMSTLDSNGLLRVWDLGTGAVAVSRSVPPGEAQRMLQFAGDVLLVVHEDTSPTGDTAYRYAGYDAGTLRPLWQTEPYSTVPGGVWTCGELICISAQDYVATVDLRTGASGRLTAGWGWATPIGGGYQLAYPVRGEREDRQRWILDAASRPLFSIAGWDATVSWPGRPYALVTRFDEVSGRFWLGRLDVALRGVVPLGVVTGANGTCDPIPGEYLVCWQLGDRITVYRYTP